ncbi:mannitol-1-phosphate 5-dehydrogenase [Enterococcus ureilyticus]|uniref:Mannitol-1-phosphate 5-dehydrogenase n=1 Tax=Enterococcus ureilyticus TaxID=1131292 RepID=A0A1E5HDG3_9ENTE|nr:mannitol-1-phosphate 5-dehydrogenase [Enterococcus ureilyticus]MBM7690038.1 mannitol-1-phosphate 5-dehydrogenase [Enterococcus ureilyticus]OEG22989.1 mannitol-1-phosphate 5-dehydrogenase [Enterococcus ureilyticus]
MKKIAVHFGAGNIGRGFIGWLLVQAGYQVVFADVDEKIVEAINTQGEYEVILANEEQERFMIEGVQAVNSSKEVERLAKYISEAKIVTTAVGPTVLPRVAEVIAKGIELRVGSAEYLTVIACENMIGGSEILQAAVLPLLTVEAKEYAKKFVAFPNSAVDRIVPNQNHENLLTVTVEPFYEWVVEEPLNEENAPEIAGLNYVPDLTPYIERKLFTVNTGHAVTAYFGHMRNIKSIEDAIHNEKVLFIVRSALEETGALLEKKFQFSHHEHQAYIDKIIERFKNPYVSDYVTRVGRSPIRKIGENDRFIQPARQFVEAFNETPKALAIAIAAAMKFEEPTDEEACALQKAIKEQGLDQTIEQYTGLKPYTKLFEKIRTSYHELV